MNNELYNKFVEHKNQPALAIWLLRLKVSELLSYDDIEQAQNDFEELSEVIDYLIKNDFKEEAFILDGFERVINDRLIQFLFSGGK